MEEFTRIPNPCNEPRTEFSTRESARTKGGDSNERSGRICDPANRHSRDSEQQKHGLQHWLNLAGAVDANNVTRRSGAVFVANQLHQ